jgi:DNA polymerase-4
MERDVLHLSIPAFPIALARIADASLRGRPVGVAPGHSERALLQFVSAEARAEGVNEGMPVFRARQFCSSLTLLPPDPALMAKGMDSLLELSGQFSPVWEPAAPGRLFIDLTGSRRLFGPGRDMAARLEREIEGRLRLQGSLGIAGNKMVSRIAAGYLTKPGICDVLRGSERGFIAPLPISVLPGVGQTREALLLRDLNLRRVEEVAALAVPQLRLVFGPFALLLHQRACGVDPSPVQPPRRTPEVIEECFLEREENDDSLLLAELLRLVERCGLRLRRQGKGAQRLTLTVTYTDGVAEQAVYAFTSHLNNDRVLFSAAEELFLKACRRRVRVKAMRLHFTRLAAENLQMDLFATSGEPNPRQTALQTTLDRLREKHGMTAIGWGRSVGTA